MAKKGLGKGLGHLFEDDTVDFSEEKSSDIQYVKLSSIEPNKHQPRKNFDEEKINTLAESIKEHGMIQPIVITPDENDMYTIVAGERRWRAAKKAGLFEIPVVIRDYNDEQIAEIALIENLQREDLNPIEEAMGYQTLLEKFNLTQEAVSKKIGRSRSAIANSIRLLTLDEEIKEMLEDGDISSGHAKAILSLESNELRLRLAERIVDERLSVRQAENLAKHMQKNLPEKKEKESDAYQIELENIQNRLSSSFGTKVKISHGDKKGKIEIEYYGNEDLERILELLENE